MAPECYILFFYGLIKCWTHLSAIDTASSDTVLSNCFLIHIIIIIFFFFFGNCVNDFFFSIGIPRCCRPWPRQLVLTDCELLICEPHKTKTEDRRWSRDWVRFELDHI